MKQVCMKFAVALFGLVVACGFSGAAEPKKPNVIFVLSDDQRYDSLGMTGNPVTKTPNLERLAKEGVFFDKAFSTSPICGPSRANIFTSQWERKNRIGFDYISHNMISMADFQNSFLMQLKQAGYSTAFIGKHHTKIVDRGDSALKENIDFCYYKAGHLSFDISKHKVFSNLKNTSQIEGIYEATEAYLKPGNEYDYFYENADKSVKGSLKRRDPEKPFCAWINFNLPHAASIGGMGKGESDPEIYKSLYADKVDQFPLPDGHPVSVSLPEDVFTDEDLMPYYRHRNPKALREMKMKMARAVHGIDLFIGNLRELLKEMGEDENTIIIFYSDNGLMIGEHGFGGKTMLYEESVHVPMMVYSPFLDESKRGQRLESLVVGQDIPATILDLCGLVIPKSYQGKSLSPLLKGEEVDWREDVFLENLFTDQGYPRQEAVRGERFKYVRHHSREDDRKQYLPEGLPNDEPIYEELFDLEADPKEQKNLAKNPEYAAVLKSLRQRCNELTSKMGE
ncbi:MAG: sulfatase-like hydrolase/transferase [Luteolibacter sp.]